MREKLSPHQTQIQELQHLRDMTPVILVGMHRSGTSLLTRLLIDLGIHMGAALSRDAEAVFFQRLDRRIFKAAGVKWSHVAPLITLMDSEAFIATQVTAMERALVTRGLPQIGATGLARFFGRKHRHRLNQGLSCAWGWKDPRATLTFPIWLRVFPHARVVHMLRNGIDVAISTHRRTLRQERKLRNHILPLDYGPETHDFAYCLHLWETYVSFALEHKHLVAPGKYIEIRFENLLAFPENELRRLLDFLGHTVSDALLTNVCERVNANRLDNRIYAKPYMHRIPALANSTLMQRLGYSYTQGN